MRREAQSASCLASPLPQDSTENHSPKALLNWVSGQKSHHGHSQTLEGKIWARFSRWCCRSSLPWCLWYQVGRATFMKVRFPNGRHGNGEWTTYKSRLANFPCHEIRLNLQRSSYWKSFPPLEKYKKTLIYHTDHHPCTHSLGKSNLCPKDWRPRVEGLRAPPVMVAVASWDPGYSAFSLGPPWGPSCQAAVNSDWDDGTTN